MQPIYASQTIQQIEQAIVAKEQIPLYQLMLRAGQSAFDLLQEEWPQAKRLLIVTGSGNNAGDALVVAKLAVAKGYQVQLLALKAPTLLSGDAQLAWQELKDLNFELITQEQFGGCDLIVEGVLGTGFKGSLSEDFRSAIQWLNKLKAEKQIPILSLDIASGIYANSGAADTDYIQADVTISFIADKLGHWLDSGLDASGKLFTASLGAEAVMTGEGSKKFTCLAQGVEQLDILDQLPSRAKNVYKNQAGHLLCIGGSEGMAGAIMLSANTALKSGAGMVTCGLHESGISAGLEFCPEVMWQQAEKTQLRNYQALALGPGLGRGNWGRDLWQDYISLKLPKVIDADALYWLAQNPQMQFELGQTVLTPHAGEAATLLSWDTAKVMEDRLAAARAIAKQYSAVCVLKGAGTIVTDGEQVWVASGAHPAMATAGLGDVLTGLIGALLAQGMDSRAAAVVAVKLHFMAAQQTAGTRNRGMLASELIPQINQLINKI